MPLPVLAVSGPSGAGKSTTAAVICSVLEAEGVSVALLHGDNHFIGPKPESYWTQENKDHPGAVDLPAVRAEIELARNSSDAPNAVVIVEGFMLLQDEPIMALVDAVLFIGCTQEECLARRLMRSVRTPHENEGLRRYYDACVWPGYLQYTAPALERLREAHARGDGRPLCELDGTVPMTMVCVEAIAALPALVPSLAEVANVASVRDEVAKALRQHPSARAVRPEEDAPETAESHDNGTPYPSPLPGMMPCG